MAKKRRAAPQKLGPATIRNRRAGYDYELLERFEAGMVLVGSEVKSLLLGKAHLRDAYCKVDGNELWVVGMDIEPYDKASVMPPERRRERKLLMHRREIDKLQGKLDEKGLALIPTAAYFKNGRVKLEVALARGKRQYDKRDKLEKKDERRQLKRELG